MLLLFRLFFSRPSGHDISESFGVGGSPVKPRSVGFQPFEVSKRIVGFRCWLTPLSWVLRRLGVFSPAPLACFLHYSACVKSRQEQLEAAVRRTF